MLSFIPLNMVKYSKKVVLLLFFFLGFISSLWAANCTGVPDWNTWRTTSFGNGDPTIPTTVVHGGNLWEITVYYSLDEPGTSGAWSNAGACSNEPGVSTGSASSITTSSATLSGTVTTDNGFSITARGFIIGTSNAIVSSATVSSLGSATLHTEGGTSTGAFSDAVSNACRNTTLYFKTYATNSEGTGYGSVVSYAVPNGTVTYTSVQAGAWSDPATWGSLCDVPYLDGFPNDNAIVSHSVTRASALSPTGGADLTISATGTLTTSADVTATGTSNVVINSGGTLAVTGNLKVNEGGSGAGRLTNDGTITVSSAMKIGGGSNSNNITASNLEFTDNTFSSSAGTITVTNDLVVGPNSAFLDLNSTTLNITNDFDFNGSAGGDIDAASAVTVGGNFTYDGGTNTAIYSSLAITGDLDLGGGATLTMSGDVDVTGFLLKTGGTKFDFSGDLTTVKGIDFSSGNGLDVDIKTGALITAPSYNASGNVDVNLDGDLTISGNVDIVGSSFVSGRGILTYGSFSMAGGELDAQNYLACDDGTQFDACEEPPFAPGACPAGRIAPLSSPFNLETCSSILPVKFSNFHAINSEFITLSWTTLIEINNAYFVIEHSRDGELFVAIDTIQGAGNSSEVLLYEYQIQRALDVGQHYFRIKQVDFDGLFDYSSIIHVQRNSQVLIKVSPNPFSGSTLLLDIANTQSEQVINYSLYSTLGKKVASNSFNIKESSSQFELNLPNDLKNGMYTLYVRIGVNEETIKVIKK